MEFQYTADASVAKQGTLVLMAGHTEIANMQIRSIIRESDGLNEIVVDAYTTNTIEQAYALIRAAMGARALDALIRC